MGLNYEKGVPLNPPSKVFRTISTNISIIEGQSACEYDFNKLKVSSKLVNAIQYFNIEGLTKYKFSYIFENKLYMFSEKETMTEAIRILVGGNNLSESSVKFFSTELVKES